MQSDKPGKLLANQFKDSKVKQHVTKMRMANGEITWEQSKINLQKFLFPVVHLRISKMISV